jgi:hypothetical protein
MERISSPAFSRRSSAHALWNRGVAQVSGIVELADDVGEGEPRVAFGDHHRPPGVLGARALEVGDQWAAVGHVLLVLDPAGDSSIDFIAL